MSEFFRYDGDCPRCSEKAEIRISTTGAEYINCSQCSFEEKSGVYKDWFRH